MKTEIRIIRLPTGATMDEAAKAARDVEGIPVFNTDHEPIGCITKAWIQGRYIVGEAITVEPLPDFLKEWV